MDKLRIYGSTIGMNHKVVTDSKEIFKAIKEMRNHELVLIDTPGICQNDKNEMNRLCDLFSEINNIEKLLVISSTKKSDIISDIIKKFNILKVNGIIFTKLDECITLGNILNSVIFCKKPIYYFANGQSIPEDIESAKIEKLIDMIVDPDNYDLILSLPTEIFAESFEIFVNILLEDFEKENNVSNNYGDKYTIKNNVYNING